MAIKMVEDMPFKKGFYNLIGTVIPKCCAECETAKFHYFAHSAGFGLSLNCKAWDMCPLRNKATNEDVTNG